MYDTYTMHLVWEAPSLGGNSSGRQLLWEATTLGGNYSGRQLLWATTTLGNNYSETHLPISDLHLYFLCALVQQRQMGQVTVKWSAVPAFVFA